LGGVILVMKLFSSVTQFAKKGLKRMTEKIIKKWDCYLFDLGKG